MTGLRRGVIALAALLGAAAGARAAAVPEGFVYLSNVDPSIIQDMRYAQFDNFVGRPIEGYGAAECILLQPAAEALARVQAALKARNLALKVYDCYRPARAVADFAEWAKDKQDQRTKAEFYPRIDKAKLFELGLIAYQSGHSRGGTVDLAIVPLPEPPMPYHRPGETRACYAPQGQRPEDNTLDFGTNFDCFDSLSATANPQIPADAAANRRLLVDAMAAEGFANLAEEWWHFTHSSARDKPLLDFPIVPRPRSASGK